MRSALVVLLSWLLLVPLALGAGCPYRLVSLAPNITEMVFRLGAGDCLLARTRFCQYPPAALQLPSVGGYLDPDLEKLASLHPDVVLMLPNPAMELRLKNLGLRVVSLPDETVADVLSSIRQLGALLHRQHEAARIIEGINDTLRQCEKKPVPVPALLVVGHQPGNLNSLYAAGANTYLSQIWERCGGRNIFDHSGHRYFPVSLEEVLVRNPQIILEFHPGADSALVSALRRDWQRFPQLKAVQNQQILILTEDYFLIPGPRISKIAVQFSHIIQAGQGLSP